MRIAFYQLVLFINTSNIDDVYYASAKTILKNIRKIPDCSITDVAQMCFVSPATISRLCRKLNFESFTDFKMAICLSVEQFNQTYRNIYFPNENQYSLTVSNGKEILAEHHRSVINTINQVYEKINFDDVLTLVDMIHNCDRVIFLGYYFSQNTAMQLQIELAYLGKECYGLFNESGQYKILSSATKDDLIILNSMTGRFIKQSTEIIRLFKKSPSKKVLIYQGENTFGIDNIHLSLKMGDNNDSLISKFSLTYLFEIIEMIYHIKYSKD